MFVALPGRVALHQHGDLMPLQQCVVLPPLPYHHLFFVESF